MRIPLMLLSGALIWSLSARAEDASIEPAPIAPVEETSPLAEVPPTESSTELVPVEEPSRWAFTLGGGAALEWRRDVNPEFGGFKVPPQIFANVRFTRWSVQLEWNFGGESDTKAGALQVRTTTTSFSGWARYAVQDWAGYRPFVALGGGVHFDRVRTQFQDKIDDRAGSRRLLGLGVGLNKTYWSWLLTEIEGRVISEEATRGTVYALNLRLGVTF